MTFTLDSNILINLHRIYPRDIFGSIWESVEAAARDGTLCICEAVLREIHRGGDDLHKWAKNLPGFTCAVTDAELQTVAEIAADHPDWVRGRTNEADPFLIAHAKAMPATVVSEENRKGPGVLDQNLKIPNVADEHGVECITFFAFMRAQGWTF
ncbi:MAG: DUF4411 family protein [Aeromicrobium sp.]